MNLLIAQKHTPHVAQFLIQGEIDAAESPHLTDAFEVLEAARSPIVVVNLLDVTFADTMLVKSLQTLFRRRDDRYPRATIVIVARPPIHRLLDCVEPVARLGVSRFIVH